MNKLISYHLSTFLSPLTNRRLGAPSYTSAIDSLCTMPGYRLLNAYAAPIISDRSIEFENETWTSLVKRTFQIFVSNTYEPSINWSMTPEDPRANHSLGAVAVYRGNQIDTLDTRMW